LVREDPCVLLACAGARKAITVTEWKVERREWVRTESGFERAPWQVVVEGDEKLCKEAYRNPPAGAGAPVDVRLWDGDRIVGQKTR